MKLVKDYYVTIIIIAFVIVINITAFAVYISNINKDIEKQTEDHLSEIMEEASTCVELKVEETIHELEMTAYYIGMVGNYEQEDISRNIKKMTEKAGFQKFDIINEKGRGLAEKGSQDYSEERFFERVMEGDISITDISGETGTVNGIRFSIPIESENGISGVYLTECNLDEFSELLDLDSVSSKGKAFIIKSDGTVLSKKSDSSIQNVEDILNNDNHVKTLKSYMKSKKSGVVGFANGKNSKRYICYSRTEFNNWEIIMVVSSSIVEANISDLTGNFVFLGVIIVVMLILLIIYFIYTLMVAKSKSNINLQRYYMVSKYIEDIIFDYSCTKDTLYCNENWNKIFGYELPKENVKEQIIRYVSEEDKPAYTASIAKIADSKEMVLFKCHILDKEQKEIECICKIFGIRDNMNKLIKIVGVITKSM